MTANGKRVVGVTVATVIVVALMVVYVAFYLASSPGDASATAKPISPGTVELNLATVAAAELSDAHPTWVSYYQVNANLTKWDHATTYILPAHSLVHVTIYQFDSQTGLRNEFLGQATGTVGGTFTLNGKTIQAIDPTTASHVFAIPQLGLSVPLYGIPDNTKNPCANAPCSLSNDHATISFTFRTQGKGLFRWQCFVPCAAGFIEGFGGPMQTVGYMDGYIRVV